jgi:hypothetical protein
MKRLVVVLASLLALAPTACFEPRLNCARCGLNDRCLAGLACYEGICKASPGETCEIDAGSPSDAQAEMSPDVGSSEASDAPGAVADASPETGPILCIDRCCVGASCLEFPARLRNGLLLWADRTSLGEPGFPLETWLDRSSNGHHLMSLNADAPPRVQLDPVGPIAEISETRMALATKGGPSLRLGIEDFTILVLARCNADAQKGHVFQKRVIGRPSTGIAMVCNHDGVPLLAGVPEAPNRAFLAVTDDDRLPDTLAGMIVSRTTDLPGKLHLLAARRLEGGRLQLRIDGRLEGEIAIPASLNFSDENPLFVASVAGPGPVYLTTFSGGVAAVVVVRGPMADEEIQALEAFLMASAGGLPPP